jgi:hypothetical protein
MDQLEEPFVFANIAGGIGNQLFQIYNAISYGLDNGKPFYFNSRAQCPRKLDWTHIFANIQNLACDTSILEKYQKTSFQESGFQYTRIPARDGNIVLSGYYQSSKYFEHNIEKINDIIGIAKLRDSIKSKYWTVISSKFPGIQIIGLHFRFGDYLGLQQYHYVQIPQYYINAINHMIANGIESPVILYFGEITDMVLINKYIGQIIPALTNKDIRFFNYRDLLGGCHLQDWEELLLMSCCDHNIISNSTFSWWSSFLNPNSSKIVCYPSMWFGPNLNHYILDDLFPEKWKCISSI